MLHRRRRSPGRTGSRRRTSLRLSNIFTSFQLFFSKSGCSDSPVSEIRFHAAKSAVNENAEEEFLAASSAVPSATHPHSRGRTRGGDRFLRGTLRNAIGVDFLLRFPCLPEGTYCLTNGGEIARIHAHHAARSRHAFSLSLTVHRHPMHGCGAFCAHGLQGNAAQRQTDGGLCAATRGCPARLHTPG